MKKTAGLIFFLALFLNAAGIFIFFKVRQFMIRQEVWTKMKSELSDDQLNHFSFLREEATKLDWEEVGREFRFEDYMYDVVHTTIKGDSIHFFCIQDNEESSLFHQLDDLVRNRMDQNRDSPGNQAKKMIQQMLAFLSDFHQNEFATTSIEFSTLRNLQRLSIYNSPSLEHIVPPPWN